MSPLTSMMSSLALTVAKTKQMQHAKKDVTSTEQRQPVDSRATLTALLP
jgi:hypothetical protein